MHNKRTTDCRRFFDVAPQSRYVCHLDLGGDAPSPDPLIGKAALDNAALGKEALDWYKQIYADSAPQRESVGKLALSLADTQLDTAKKQNQYADESYAYMRDTFRPLERQIVADAQAYDTPARREANRAAAVADVEQEVSAQRAASGRALQRAGIAPGSGKQLSLQGALDIGAARAKAAAGTQSVLNTEAVGAARKLDAASLGRNLPANNATQTQLGLNAGNSAVGNAQVPGQQTAQGVQLMGTGFNTGMQGNQSAAGIMTNLYGQQVNAARADDGALQGLGQLGMSAAYLWGSDKNQKTGRKKVSGKLALDAIRKTPVEKWKYKGNSEYADGGKTHVGPMAQDVQKNMGDDVAPDGKVIDLVSANGVAMAAIKELDRKVISLEKASRRSA